jgi:hypothetical protein
LRLFPVVANAHFLQEKRFVRANARHGLLSRAAPGRTLAFRLFPFVVQCITLLPLVSACIVENMS